MNGFHDFFLTTTTTIRDCYISHLGILVVYSTESYIYMNTDDEISFSLWTGHDFLPSSTAYYTTIWYAEPYVYINTTQV